MTAKTCETCGAELKGPRAQRAGTRFCPASRCRVAAHRARQRAQADARQADHADQLSDRLDLDQEQPMSEGHYRPADFYKPKADAPPRPRPVGHFRPADFYKPKAAERDDPAA